MTFTPDTEKKLQDIWSRYPEAPFVAGDLVIVNIGGLSRIKRKGDFKVSQAVF